MIYLFIYAAFVISAINAMEGGIFPRIKIDLSLRKPLHFVIRRERTTIFLDADEEMTVLQFKEMIANVIKLPLDKFRIYKEDLTPLDAKLFDLKQKLKAMGYWVENTPPYEPATIFMRYFVGYTNNGKPIFEELRVSAYSKVGSAPQKSISQATLKTEDNSLERDDGGA